MQWLDRRCLLVLDRRRRGRFTRKLPTAEKVHNRIRSEPSCFKKELGQSLQETGGISGSSREASTGCMILSLSREFRSI